MELPAYPKIQQKTLTVFKSFRAGSDRLFVNTKNLHEELSYTIRFDDMGFDIVRKRNKTANIPFYIFLAFDVLYLYGGDPGEVVRLLIAIIMLLILFFSFVMSLFFANTFNTGVFVRRSVVNATLFLLIVFIYNTLEHYVLHWISHKLHVSDVIISSMLSGVLVLLIAPLHHRLTHYLNKKLKGGHR